MATQGVPIEETTQGVPIGGMPIAGTPIEGIPIEQGSTINDMPLNPKDLIQGEPVLVSAPIIQDLGSPPEYESLTSNTQPLPPSLNVNPTVPKGPERNVFGIPDILEDEIRSCLVNWATEECCYGTSAARDIVIKSIQMTYSYHYILTTFTEKRETSRKFVPYDGVSPFDGPHNGPAPAIWDIPVTPANDFAEQKVVKEIPHTSKIEICHGCSGIGKTTCSSCRGIGSSKCWNCKGVGHHHHTTHDSHGHHKDEHHTCHTCRGSGRNRCSRCSGVGVVKCKTCKTWGKLRYFNQLHIKWQNHRDDFVSDATELKASRIKNVQGIFAINEIKPRAFPLEGFPDRRIANASRSILDTHGKGFALEKVLKQQQAVKVVPIAVVYYEYKDTEGHFYVYGHESDRQVYFENYPQSCCWLCSIL